jgi:hypothetical protein
MPFFISGDTIFLFQLRTIDYTCDIVYTTNLGINWETLTQRSNINVRGVPYKNKQNNNIYVGLVTVPVNLMKPFGAVIIMVYCGIPYPIETLAH